jgi:hypothetical protein
MLMSIIKLKGNMLFTEATDILRARLVCRNRPRNGIAIPLFGCDTITRNSYSSKKAENRNRSKNHFPKKHFFFWAPKKEKKKVFIPTTPTKPSGVVDHPWG